MQTATVAEKPRKQAISGRFWAGRTYRGRIKDDHKIESKTRYLIQFNDFPLRGVGFGRGVGFQKPAFYV